jgi:GAF domain-containing protein
LDGDEDRTRTSRVLYSYFLVALAIAVLSVLAVLLLPSLVFSSLVLGAIVCVVIASLALMRIGRVRVAGALLLLALWALSVVLMVYSGGARSIVAVGLIVTTTIAWLSLSWIAGAAFAAAAILAALGTLVADRAGFLPSPALPLNSTMGWLVLCVNVLAVTAVLSAANSDMRQATERSRVLATKLEKQRRRLEEIVAERTLELELHARYLEATAEVARDTTSMLDLQGLLSRTVVLVSERFGFYHCGIFLLDASREWAELRAASSQDGQRLLARGHRLRVGEQGIVGYVTRRGEPRIALDVGGDATLVENADLPDTRSEMALPLKARDEIIGVLDVQSQEPQAFSEEDVSALQTLADQIATAISNARLFERVQDSLEAERRAYGEVTEAAWKELLRVQSGLGFRRDSRGIVPTGGPRESPTGAATEVGAELNASSRGLSVPIEVRGHVIGAIAARKPENAAAWTPQETDAMHTLAEQLGMALDNARLYQRTQRQSVRDQQLREISMRMQSQVRLDDVLQAVVSDLAKELGVPSAFVQLNTGLSQVEFRTPVNAGEVDTGAPVPEDELA